VRDSGGRLVLGAPMRLHRRLGVTVLTALGAEVADFTDVLADPAVPGVAGAFAAVLAELPGWSAVDLPEAAPEAAVGRLLESWPGQTVTRRASPCLELPVDAPEALLAGLPAKARQDLRRQLRRVDRFGLGAQVVPGSPGEIAAAVGDLLDLHRSQWARRGGNPLHLLPSFRRYLVGAAQSLVPAGQAALTRHLVDGAVAGVGLFLLGTDMVGGYLYGVDRAVRDRVDVTAMMIRSGLELGRSLGLSRLNMLRGSESGKLRWCPSVRHNRQILLLPPAIGPGHALSLARLLTGAAAEKLHGSPRVMRLLQRRRASRPAGAGAVRGGSGPRPPPPERQRTSSPWITA